MPVLTVTPATLKDLGINSSLLETSPLTADALKPLSALLVARGFDLARPVAVVALEGRAFLLTQ
jgi:hypothetical protein